MPSPTSPATTQPTAASSSGVARVVHCWLISSAASTALRRDPDLQVVAVETGTLVREAIQLVEETGFTRIPAYRGNPDQIVGFVHLFDLLKTPGIGLPVDGLLRPIGFVPEGKPCDELLREQPDNSDPEEFQREEVTERTVLRAGSTRTLFII